MATTFTIYCIPYFDQYNKMYQSILSIDEMPEGPLSHLVHRIQYPKLSPFQQYNNCNNLHNKCKYAIKKISNVCEYNCNYKNKYASSCGLMTNENINHLTSFLLSNGYQIETQITNMMNNSDIRIPRNKMVYTVTYYGNNKPQICYMR